MSTSDPLSAWRREFLAEFAIDAEALAVSDPAAPAQPDTSAGIPVRYAGALATHPGIRAWMADVTRRAIKARRVAINVATGGSLLLLGITGTGKTWQAYGVVRGFSALGVRTHYRVTTAADLYARLRPRHGIDSEDVFEEYAGAPLLIIDDLGAVKNSEWIEEVNYRVVNHRYERMLPTLFTSNLLPNELGGVLGERVSSRLNEMAERVSLKGEDRRYAA
jgi:DNA replication protein DnaC